MSPWRPWPTRDNARHARFEQWVEDHTQAMFAFAYRLCGDRELADELVQEAFYQAWKSMDQLRDPDRSKAWLMQILRHGYARWARQRRRDNVAHDGLSAQPARPAAGPADQLAHRDTLQQALDQLPERYRITFVLVFVANMTCEEAARELDVPLGTVLSRLHRARQRLCETINALDEPGTSLQTSHDATSTAPPLRLGGEA